MFMSRNKHSVPGIPPQVVEKSADLLLTHLTRIPLVVKQDEPLGPVYIRLLGSKAVVFGLNGKTNLIK